MERRLAVKMNNGITHVGVGNIRFPKGWQGGRPKQLKASAEKILEPYRAEDPRRGAAQWVVDKLNDELSPNGGGD